LSSTVSQTQEHRDRNAADLVAARRAAGGDRAAKRQLAGRLLERVRATTRYLSANDRDRDDWVQLSLLEILASLGSFRGNSSLEKWADRITVRTVMRLLKQRRRREQKVSLIPEPPPEMLTTAGPSFEELLIRERVAEHLSALEPDNRAVVVLKLVHGYKVDEIAELVGAPRDTVKGRLKRGRRRLKEQFANDSVLAHLLNEEKS